MNRTASPGAKDRLHANDTCSAAPRAPPLPASPPAPDPPEASTIEPAAASWLFVPPLRPRAAVPPTLGRKATALE